MNAKKTITIMLCIALFINPVFSAPVAQKTAAKPASKTTSKITAKPAAAKNQYNNAAAFYRAGAAYQKSKNYPFAVKSYEKAIRLSPNMWQAWLGMGLSYYAQGQMQNARLCFTKVLGLKPNEPTAKKYWALAEPNKNIAYKKQKEKPKTKADMAWRSALLPGAGQFYNNEKTKGYIYSIMFLASIGGIIKFTLDEQSAVSKYENTNVDFDKYYKDAETAQMMVYIPIGTAALFWTLSVVDCFMSGADDQPASGPGYVPQVFVPEGGGVGLAWSGEF